MPIDPNDPPALPPEVKGRRIRRTDGSFTYAVSKRDAARLIAVPESAIVKHIGDGSVDVCRHPDTSEHLVLIDSLWLLVPEEQRA